MKPAYKIIALLLCIFAGINSNAQTMDITENLSGEIWKTPNDDFVLQFFDNGVYETKERYENRIAVTKGRYKVDTNANTIFLYKNGQGINENYVVPITKIRIDEKKSNDTYLATFFGGYKQNYGKAPEKPIAEPEPSSLGQKQLIRTKETQQQKINKLLEKLNSWVLGKVGAFDTDAYERPYAYPYYVSNGETNGWVSSCQNQLYQLGATVIWNENKKKYELETNQHLIARRQFVEVYVDKILYQSEKAPAEYFLKFSIKNTGKQNIGFNLSYPNNIFYANQWGKYSQPYRGEINEGRVIFEQENLTSLIAQYKEGTLKMIKPNEQLDYYINLDGSTDNMVLNDKSGFFIVTIDGQMKFTDGYEAELISLEKSDDDVQRAIVFPLPAILKTIPEKQLMFVNKKIIENRH